MATKLTRNTYPAGTGPNSFKCFGPIATVDGEFHSARMADMGCFKQDGADTNKAYHGAVVQDKGSGKWYAFYMWGRTGGHRDFQFYECRDEADAVNHFVKQMESKSVKRGEWATIAGRRVLRAKPGEDCYLVRPLATRSSDAFGLPDAASVVSGDVKVERKNGAKKKAVKREVDQQTVALMKDLNVATIEYTRKSMVGGTLPTMDSIDRARELLTAAQNRLVVIGDNVESQVNDREMMDLTTELYGRIPKVKRVGAPRETWVLSTNNIIEWQQNLDAYESGLKTATCIEEIDSDVDPLGGLPIEMSWMNPKSPEGEFLLNWMPIATRNRHSNVGNMRIHNMWRVTRNGQPEKFMGYLKRVAAEPETEHRPDRQPKRIGMEQDMLDLFDRGNVGMLHHGTRSVNVSGILREGLRLPRQLSGISMNGALMGGGHYWADDWKKSHGYTSLPNSYYVHGEGAVRGRKGFIFLADVALGRSYLTPRGHGYTEPPSGYHSVFGKGGHTQFRVNSFSSYRTLANNEWVTYCLDAYNFRYLVEFSA